MPCRSGNYSEDIERSRFMTPTPSIYLRTLFLSSSVLGISATRIIILSFSTQCQHLSTKVAGRIGQGAPTVPIKSPIQSPIKSPISAPSRHEAAVGLYLEVLGCLVTCAWPHCAEPAFEVRYPTSKVPLQAPATYLVPRGSPTYYSPNGVSSLSSSCNQYLHSAK